MKEECQMVEVPCPNEGCSEIVVKRNLNKHLQQCEYRAVNCQWCKQDIYYDQRQVRNAAEHIELIFDLLYFNYVYRRMKISVFLFQKNVPANSMNLFLK